MQSHQRPWRKKLYTIIFEAETPAGRLFDLLLIWSILLSVVAVCLESIQSYKLQYGTAFTFIEWTFTFLFTIEYIFRIICVRRPLSYVFSFYGLVDLLTLIPTYISWYFVGAHSLIVIRSIRLLRIFRLFKLARFVGEADILGKALGASRHKIIVFLTGAFSIVLFMGALMYLVEGEASGYTSIPKSMYWAIVTMTTVGYGDLVPQTDMGKFIASLLMIMGYGILAVPTGIVSVEIANASRHPNTLTCPQCLLEGHALDAHYCRVCSHKL
jgi:voltage-gated potassium channel